MVYANGLHKPEHKTLKKKTLKKISSKRTESYKVAVITVYRCVLALPLCSAVADCRFHVCIQIMLLLLMLFAQKLTERCFFWHTMSASVHMCVLLCLVKEKDIQQLFVVCTRQFKRISYFTKIFYLSDLLCVQINIHSISHALHSSMRHCSVYVYMCVCTAEVFICRCMFFVVLFGTFELKSDVKWCVKLSTTLAWMSFVKRTRIRVI